MGRSDRKRSRSRERKKSRDRDRKRSRSRERKRSRSRSRSPRRDKSKSPRRGDKDRDRKRDRDRDRDRKRDRGSPPPVPKKQKDVVELLDTNISQTDLQNELERQMEERRRKVELWRARNKQGRDNDAREKEDLDKEKNGKADSSKDKREKGEKKDKKWSLEDEDDEDEFGINTTEMETDASSNVKKEETDDEVDPLDAFMSSIATSQKPKSGMRVVTITSSAQPEKEKGELLENEDRQDLVVDDVDMESATSLCHKGRMLPVTDHTKVYYKPFRKEFYNETQEIAKMTKEEVAEYRKEMDDIQVKGKNCPRPVKTWAQCGVEWKILNQLKKMNYAKPTPIQAQAIPAITFGRDVIGIAKTGSGKTLAFLLPMFRHILDQEELDEMDGPIALIMAPTRELAMQTWKEANRFAKVLNLRVVCAYGGVPISDQIADLKRQAEIIICTPGRMIDLLAANSGRVTNLRRVTYLVLDEADRMFDMGFEPQVMKIVNNVRPDRQTVLFSATFPKKIEALAIKILNAPVEILVGGKSVVCNDITQNAIICEEHQKLLKLLELLGVYYMQGNTIVFVDRQEKADDIVGTLMQSGYRDSASLHGGIDQSDRDSVINDFKSGRLKVLVATSVAARGLDVKNLILVVNYDCPNHYEDYVHRVGRTGRAGNKGYAYTFVLTEHQERMAGELCKAFETAGAKPPPELKAMYDRFKADMESQGKKVVLGTKGFAGSGYKFDEDEASAEASQKQMTRLVQGQEAGAIDDDELEEKLNMMLKSKRRMVEGQMSANQQKVNAKVEDQRTKAREIAENLESLRKTPNVVEKSAVSRVAETVIKGGNLGEVELTPQMRARQMASRLNEKLNYLGGEEIPTTSKEEEWQYFEEEMEINDFPAPVRFRVCSRESVGQVAEYADVGISVRGKHYDHGKEPKEGQERRLYLLIEARNESNLKRAKDEIIRIMKDAFKQLNTQMARGGPQARYKV